MSDALKGGGPAFSVPDSHHANGQVQYGCNGMSKREWFAGMALPKVIEEACFYSRKACESDVIANDVTWNEACGATDADCLGFKCEEVAVAALRYADAMLAALEKEDQP